MQMQVGTQKCVTHLQGEERVPFTSLGHCVMVSASLTATLCIGAREHLFPLGQSRSLHEYLCRRQDGGEGWSYPLCQNAGRQIRTSEMAPMKVATQLAWWWEEMKVRTITLTAAPASHSAGWGLQNATNIANVFVQIEIWS